MPIFETSTLASASRPLTRIGFSTTATRKIGSDSTHRATARGSRSRIRKGPADMLTYTYPRKTAETFVQISANVRDHIHDNPGESMRSALWMMLPVEVTAKEAESLLSFVGDHLDAQALDEPITATTRNDVLERLSKALSAATSILEHTHA